MTNSVFPRSIQDLKQNVTVSISIVLMIASGSYFAGTRTEKSQELKDLGAEIQKVNDEVRELKFEIKTASSVNGIQYGNIEGKIRNVNEELVYLKSLEDKKARK
jgi:hypothetical protein